MHDESLSLPQDHAAHGLIRGWSESDSCLVGDPSLYWQPHTSQQRFRGSRLQRHRQDLDGTGTQPTSRRHGKLAADWSKRGQTLRRRTVESVEKNIQRDKTPPYIGLFPGTTLTFRESLQTEKPSPQQWPHRAYAELLQADVLPANLANLVIDCMRAYGATTIGVVANVGGVHRRPRDSRLHFLRVRANAASAGPHRRIPAVPLRASLSRPYAGQLDGRRSDRHYWRIRRSTAFPRNKPFRCIARWMLVLEDSDEDRLYLAKGVPRRWVASGKKISIEQAPTRWGRVSFTLQAKPETGAVVGQVDFAGAKTPAEVNFKLRVPAETKLRSVTVNGRAAKLAGPHGDTVVIATGGREEV